jgi:hypothetical protein
MSLANRPALFILMFCMLCACATYTGTPLDTPRAWWLNFMSGYPALIIFIVALSMVGRGIYIYFTDGGWDNCKWFYWGGALVVVAIVFFLLGKPPFLRRI